jgi:hypothetical protein
LSFFSTGDLLIFSFSFYSVGQVPFKFCSFIGFWGLLFYQNPSQLWFLKPNESFEVIFCG